MELCDGWIFFPCRILGRGDGVCRVRRQDDLRVEGVGWDESRRNRIRLAPLQVALRYFTPVAEVDLCGHATIACLGLLHTRNLLGGALLGAALGAEGIALTVLNLEGNRISADGLKLLSNALAAKASEHGLIDLNLSGNPCGDCAEGSCTDGMTALATLLRRDASITRLNLKYSGVGSDGLAMLARALRLNRTLIALQHTVRTDLVDRCVPLMEGLAAVMSRNARCCGL